MPLCAKMRPFSTKMRSAMTKMNAHPHFRDHPNDKDLPQNQSCATQNNQSRTHENHNGYQDSYNDYAQSNDASQNLSQVHQSQTLLPSQTYGYPCHQGHRSSQVNYDDQDQSTQDEDKYRYNSRWNHTNNNNRPRPYGNSNSSYSFRTSGSSGEIMPTTSSWTQPSLPKRHFMQP